MRTRNKVLAVALPAIALAGAILYFRPNVTPQKEPGYHFEKKRRLLERVEKELIYGGGER